MRWSEGRSQGRPQTWVLNACQDEAAVLEKEETKEEQVQGEVYLVWAN